MLREPRRLISSGVAIVLGVAFVAAALLLGDALNATLKDAAAGTVNGASVVITRSKGDAVITPAVVDAVRRAPGITDVRPTVTAGVSIGVGGREDFYVVANLPRLSARTTLASGRLPAASGEVALNKVGADARGVRLGDRLEVPGVASGPRQVLVVGVLDAGSDATDQPGMPLMFLTDADALAWAGGSYSEVFVHAPGPQESVAASVRAVLAIGAAGLDVQTADAVVAERVEQLTRGTASLVGVLLGFAAISLFVSALVIANTFGILVAQRTRQLALLRCVGASRRQVFGGVLGEAALLGTLAGVVGVAVGLGLAYAAVMLSQGSLLTLTGLSPTWPSLVVPVLAGLTITVLAAIVPARQATRIAPLAALRTGAVADAARPGRLRIASGVALVAFGTLGLVVGGVLGLPRTAQAASVPASFLLGVVGGAVSFVGVLLLAPRVVPAVARGFAPALRRLAGVPGELASENAVRNPKRAAATASALLIGVTLITMMSVAAASGQASAMGRLEGRYPVDALVMGPSGTTDAPLLAATRSAKGVQQAVAVSTWGGVSVEAGEKSFVDDVYALAPSDATVTRNPHFAQGLTDDTIVVPQRTGIVTGTAVTVRTEAASLTLTAVLADRSGTPLLVTPATLKKLAPHAATVIWVRFADGADALTASTEVGKAVAEVTPGAIVGGAAQERQQFQTIIDTALAIVVGLLGVAVLIALVGIGNTLSLSVFERARESALLRALGLTRRELRRSVALEALLLAGVAVLLGLGLGIGYGIAGAAALLGASTPLIVDVPVARLALVAAVALLAGWLASVLPAARAARVSPAAALADP